MKNYYKILEVNENASIEVIEKAYKVLVKKYHPDLQANNPDAEKKIREINEAYNVLSDQFLKEQYDQELQQQSNAYNQNNYQESDYSRLYKEKQKLKYQLAHERYDKERIEMQKKAVEREAQEGNDSSANGMVSILRGLIKYRPTMENIKELKKVDLLALALTIVIVITIGIILYFLPFTHDWMNRNFIDTPLVNWLKGIF